MTINCYNKQYIGCEKEFYCMIHTIKCCDKTIHNVWNNKIIWLCSNIFLYQWYNILYFDHLSITRYNKFCQIRDLSFRGKMSRCVFCGMIILPAKIPSIQVEKMVHDCQQDCLPGVVPTSTQISIVVSTGWDIWLKIFLAGQKNTDGGNIFRFMKLEESMVGEDSEPEEMCSELAG